MKAWELIKALEDGKKIRYIGHDGRGDRTELSHKDVANMCFLRLYMNPDEYEIVKIHELIGEEVWVYDRYLFAVPVKGSISGIAEIDGAYKVIFYSNNPGGPNVLKHNGKYFLKEQCRVIERTNIVD